MNMKHIKKAICLIGGALLIYGCAQMSRNTKDSPKESEQKTVDSLHVLEVGDKYVDAELFDMQGNKHRLSEVFSDDRYVLLDFWNLGCGACRQSESELTEVYDRMKGRLEIVGINLDSIPRWQNHEWSKKIVWKNWNDGKGYKGGIKSHYFDWNFVPFYVLLSPDGRILWEMAGYGTGHFLGIADALNGPKQDNYNNPNLAIRTIQILPLEKSIPTPTVLPSVSAIIQRRVSGSALPTILTSPLMARNTNLPMILTSLPTVRNTN